MDANGACQSGYGFPRRSREAPGSDARLLKNTKSDHGYGVFRGSSPGSSRAPIRSDSRSIFIFSMYC